MKSKFKLVLSSILFLLCYENGSAQESNPFGLAPKYGKTEKRQTQYEPVSIPYTNTGYGYDALSGDVPFISMPIPAGTPFTIINPTPFPYDFCSGGDIADGIYYGSTYKGALGQSDLVRVNIVTGERIFIGSITGIALYPTCLEFNETNSTWYYGETDGTISNLYTLNIANNSATFIGQITGCAGLISMAIDCDGNAYGVDIITDQLFSINLETGSGTPIGSLGFNAHYLQGADFDAATNTMYLAAYNGSLSQGEFRSVDLATGNTTFITAWPGSEITGFAIDNPCGPPCTVGTSSNPFPPNGANNVLTTGVTLNWTNGLGTEDVELWFGPVGNVVKVYEGTAINSSDLPVLEYNTTYKWYVVCKDSICATNGPLWSFNTEPEPFQGYWCEEFNDMSYWTVVGPLGLTNWGTSYTMNSSSTPPELKLAWTPSFNGESKIRSDVLSLQNNQGYVFSFNLYFDWYDDPSGTVSVGITYDGGITSTILYSITDPTGNVGPMVITDYFSTPPSGSQNAQLEITFSGNSFNNDNIYWDEMCIFGCLSCIAPFAPNNLETQLLSDDNPKIQLNWDDNSWNEYGFIINRKFGYPYDTGDFIAIDTIQANLTQYTDTTVLLDSIYSYRVFAFNEYGQNGSNYATIQVSIPVELASFLSEVNNNSVLLFWQTVTETNNHGFEVERQEINVEPAIGIWDRIGFIDGKGTTTEIQNYSFNDEPKVGKYKYRLKQIDFDGTYAYSVEIDAEIQAPSKFSLDQNFPNPFNPTTKITWQSPVAGNQTLKVYDVLGNEVATIVDEFRNAGIYEVDFNASKLSSGVYFYQLKAGDFISTKKMILIK